MTRYGGYTLKRGDRDPIPVAERAKWKRKHKKNKTDPAKGVWGGEERALDTSRGAAAKIGKGGSSSAPTTLKVKADYVKQLQQDLRHLGFLFVKVTGRFGMHTEMGVREFQIYANSTLMPKVAHWKGPLDTGAEFFETNTTLPAGMGLPAADPPERASDGGPISDYVRHLEAVKNESGYTGGITGSVDEATRDAIALWRRKWWRCPVVIEAYRVTKTHERLGKEAKALAKEAKQLRAKAKKAKRAKSDDAEELAAEAKAKKKAAKQKKKEARRRRNDRDRQAVFVHKAGSKILRTGINLWHPRDVPTSAPRVYARDFSGHLRLSGSRASEDYVTIGEFNGKAKTGGPNSTAAHSWREARLTGESLVGTATLSEAQQSNFRVVYAVSINENSGRFDVVNAYDGSVISVGPCHWTLAQGELPGFMAYLHEVQATDGTPWFHAFGFRANGDKLPTMSVSKKYSDRMALVVGSGKRKVRNSDWDYLNCWHWFYRWVMAGRATTRPT